ncbi:hypothetical protein Tco_1221493 [Tanacetum coccineum]
MHILKDPSLFLTNKTGAPQGDVLSAALGIKSIWNSTWRTGGRPEAEKEKQRRKERRKKSKRQEYRAERSRSREESKAKGLGRTRSSRQAVEEAGVIPGSGRYEEEARKITSSQFVMMLADQELYSQHKSKIWRFKLKAWWQHTTMKELTGTKEYDAETVTFCIRWQLTEVEEMNRSISRLMQNLCTWTRGHGEFELVATKLMIQQCL